MKTTHSAGGVVLNARGEIALVQNGSAAFWGFPKGHIDEGEDALSAAKREIEEETGLTDITYIEDLGSYERYKGVPGGGDDISELKTIHMYLFTTTEGKLMPRDAGNPEARWVPQENVETLLTHSKDKAFFRTLKTRLASRAY